MKHTTQPCQTPIHPANKFMIRFISSSASTTINELPT